MNDTTTIAANLAAAEQDLALWRRLNDAERVATQLRQEYAKAMAAQEKADAAAAKEIADARFAGLGSIRVKRGSAGQEGSGLLAINFTITWMAPEYDMYSMTSLPREQFASGFAALPGKVLAYLIEKHPEQIPADILALAPGDPDSAFERYFIGKRRGYLTGPVAA